MKPMLKKTFLDLKELKNQVVLNVPFLAEVIEKLILTERYLDHILSGLISVRLNRLDASRAGYTHAWFS